MSTNEPREPLAIVLVDGGGFSDLRGVEEAGVGCVAARPITGKISLKPRGFAMLKRLIFAAVLACLASPALAVNFCYVTEFSDAGQPVVRTPPVVDQAAVTVSAVTAQSAAFGSDSKIARISCDTTVSAAFGANPSATVNNMRLPANVPEYFYILPGQKVAFITNQ